MSVLGKNILVKHGPYNCFSVVDNPINEENLSKKIVFLEFAEDLLGAFCTMTKSYSPFDPHFDTQFEKPYDNYEFTSKLLLWEWQLTRAPENYFIAALDYINYPSSSAKDHIYTTSATYSRYAGDLALHGWRDTQSRCKGQMPVH